MPILYRALKGAPLTAEEVDNNFKDLDTRLKSLEDSPPDAEGIASISVENGQMTLQGTQGNTFGPFALPKVFWKARGPWQKNTLYAPFDVVAYGTSLWGCLIGHTSGETFQATSLWQEIFSFPELSTTPDKNESAAVAAPPCEKGNLPQNPAMGQMVLVIDAPDHPEICYFNGKTWLRLNNHEEL